MKRHMRRSKLISSFIASSDKILASLTINALEKSICAFSRAVCAFYSSTEK